MGSAFHQLCPRYSGTLTPTAPTAIRLWDTFTFYSLLIMYSNIVTPDNHLFSFGTNGKVVVLGVPILKHFRVAPGIVIH